MSTDRTSPRAPRLEEPRASAVTPVLIRRLSGFDPGPDLAQFLAPASKTRSRFERLRRNLPYGLTQPPVIRYLTDEPFGSALPRSGRSPERKSKDDP